MNMLTFLSATVLLAAAAPAASLAPASVSASRDLPPKYTAERAADGDDSTQWAVPNQPPQWLRIDFAAPGQLDTLRVLTVDSARLYDNWRRVTVSFSDGSAFPVTLADRSGWHTITFPVRTAAWVKFTIESAYKRTHYLGCRQVQALAAGHGADTVRVDPEPDLMTAVAIERPGVTAAANPADTHWAPDAQDLAVIDRLAEQAPNKDGHPNLWVNADDIARARHHIRTRQWAFNWFQNTLRAADAWTAKTPAEIQALVPPKHAVFDNKAPCPACGKALTASFERPHVAWCTTCKRAFPDDEFADDGNGWIRPDGGKPIFFHGLYNDMAIQRFDHALARLADAYALTAEEPFARAVSVILDAIAVIYPTCDKGPKWYPGVGGRLNRPFYQAARTLIHYADQYDLTYASPEWDEPSADPAAGTRRANVATNFLRNGAEYCFSEIQRITPKSLNNGFCDYLQGMVAAGRVLRVEDWLHYALTSELSIFHFIENTIDRDGQYFETAFMYSSHALDLFSHHAEMLRYYRTPGFPAGLNLYEHPKLKLAFLRSERDVDCAGHVPPLGDTGPTTRRIRTEERTASSYMIKRLEFLAARLEDQAERSRALDLLREAVGDIEAARARAGGLTRWLVFNAADIGPADDARPLRHTPAAPIGHTVLAGPRGIGILRTGRHEETCALLRWGPTLNHGSPDEMNVNLFALGREITYDPGYLWAHLRAGWTKATGSHNLVVVDEQNQLAADGSGGSLELWTDGPGIAAVAADNPLCYRARGVTRYRRTVLLADVAPGRHYFLDIFRVEGGHTHDLNWHFLGDLTHTHGITLPEPETSGSLAGPDIEWWKLLRPDGWLEGVNEGFYWKAPPGNGYGFIFNLRRVPNAPDCSFDWTLGTAFPEPTHRFAPADVVLHTAERHHRLLGSGVYFCRMEAPGDFIEFALSVEAEDEYVVLAQFYKSSHYAIVQAAVDGVPLGEPVNLYSPSGYSADPIALGTRQLGPGQHVLRLTVVGKDAESAGWFVGLEGLAIETPQRLREVSKPVPEAVRLNLALPPATELIAGRAKSSGRFPEADYVISRRRADADQALSSVFVSLVEPYVGEPLVARPRRLTPLAEPDGNSPADTPGLVALCVQAGQDRTDYIFEAPEPVPTRLFRDGQRELRFGGRFGVVRVVGGRVRTLGLCGPGLLEVDGRRVLNDPGVVHGTVTSLDPADSTVIIDAALPDTDLSGCVAYFTNPAWTRTSAFRVQAAAPLADGSTRLELEAASLVMAHGLVDAVETKPGTIANIVPLDHERMVHRAFRTEYLQGRTLAADDGSNWGRVAHVDTRTGHIHSTEPVQPRPGQRFTVVELAPGDTVRIMLHRWESFE